jgi:hypothetical protein
MSVCARVLAAALMAGAIAVALAFPAFVVQGGDAHRSVQAPRSADRSTVRLRVQALSATVPQRRVAAGRRVPASRGRPAAPPPVAVSVSRRAAVVHRASSPPRIPVRRSLPRPVEHGPAGAPTPGPAPPTPAQSPSAEPTDACCRARDRPATAGPAEQRPRRRSHRERLRRPRPGGRRGSLRRRAWRDQRSRQASRSRPLDPCARIGGCPGSCDSAAARGRSESR